MKSLVFLLLLSLILLSCNVEQDPYNELYQAIRRGDKKKVQEIINSGLNLNPKGKQWTPLMIAVLRNDKEMVDLLLKNNADIHLRNTKGQTPLHLAARWGKKEMVEHLIQRGAFLESRDWLSWTPLMWASLRGRDEIVKVLLEKGANVNVSDIDGNTPLILSAHNNHISTAKILMSYGANKFLKNKEGKTACDIAKSKEFKDFLKFLGSCD